MQGPPRSEFGERRLCFVRGLFEQTGVNREDEALGGSLPAKTVFRAGGKKDHRARRRTFDAVTTGGPPFDGLIAGYLEMKTEIAMHVLGNFYGGDGVMFHQKAAPRLIRRLVMAAGHKRDHLIVSEDRDPV